MPGKSHARREFVYRFVLALLPAAIFGLYNEFPALAWLAYLAPVPWVLLYTDPRRRVAGGWYVLGAWLTFLVFYRPTFKYGAFVPAVFATVYFVPALVFVPFLRALYHRWHWPRVAAVPVAWVAGEYVRAVASLAHLDLNRLGVSQARFAPLIQVADLTGVYGISFLVALVSACLAEGWFAFRDQRGDRPAAGRRLWRPALVLAAAFGLTLLYGVWRLRTLEVAPGPRLAVVQPNVLHTLRNVQGVHLRQVILTERDVEPGSADLIVWPENAILEDFRNEPAFVEDLRWLSARKGAPVLLGALHYRDDQPGRTTNAAFLVGPEGPAPQRYDKRLLFPWSEYVPMDDVLGRWAPKLQWAYRKLVRRGWGFLPSGTPGADPELLELRWRGRALPFGVLICNENAHPPMVPVERALGARFVVHITSEGEVGGPIQEQLLRISILRAVENRLAYVRCGNTGISGFVDPGGRVRSILVGRRGGTIFDQGVLVDQVPLYQGGMTFYSRFPDVLGWGSLLLCLAAWGMSPLRRLLGGGRRAPVGVVCAVSALAAAAVVSPSCRGGSGPGLAPAEAAGLLEKRVGEGRCEGYLELAAAACAGAEVCPGALENVGACALREAEPERGAAWIRRLAAGSPALRPMALRYEGYLLERSLAWEEAEAAYRASLEASPDPRVWVQLGSLLARQRRFREAGEAYAEALSLDPAHVRARYLLGRVLRILGEGDRAESELLAVLADRPEFAPAWTELGRVHLERGETAAARGAWLRAVRDAGHPDARFFLARLALRDGDLAEAERWSEEVRRIEAGLGRGRRDPW